jgi:simple sugar transport system ATP-binding protein
MRGIVKRYGPVVAVDRVDFEAQPGEIHAIAGENGAGKSTLMRVLYGMTRPDEGTLAVHGTPFVPRGPRDARVRGLGMVHQHFMLVGTLTALENAMLGEENGAWLDRTGARERIEATAARFELDVRSDARVDELSVGERQRLEILKVLLRGARTLILDEPTAVLAPAESRALFRTLARLAEEGATVLVVTHRMREVIEHADRVTVLRRGRHVATLRTSDTDERALTRLVVGRDREVRAPQPRAEAGAPVLVVREARDVAKDSRLDEVSLTVNAGEIVGLAGVEGNGQRELLEALAGLRSYRGSISVNGREIAAGDPAQVRRLGVSHLPEDRREAGGIASFTLAENLILGCEGDPPFRRGVGLDLHAIDRHARERLAAFDVRPPDPCATFASLSGGNQQKVVFARVTGGAPALLLAAHPTRGIDVGAAEAIHAALLDARDRGVAVLLVSADLSEVLQLSDRIVVMYAGRIAGEVSRARASEETVGPLMTGASAGATAR